MVRNSDLAADSRVRARYGVLSRALLAGASAQLRNKATTGGNLLQRTRCYYFYDITKPCNKRSPGSGCAALAGFNRIHAILGASDQCIATHPSDMAVAMRALDAKVETVNAEGRTRAIPIADFHRLPGTTPQIDTKLQRGRGDYRRDAAAAAARRQIYRKVRDRASYAFALVSVAAVVDTRGRPHPLGAHRLRRAGAQAMAGGAGGADADRRPGECGRASTRRRPRCWRARAATAPTISRYRWPGGALHAVLAEVTRS